MNVGSSLEALYRLIVDQTDMDHVPVRDGCSPAEISRLEKAVGHSLPEDYQDLLAKSNGHADRTLTFPPDQLVFLSSTEVEKLWGELQQYRDDTFIDDLQDHDRVRGVLYHPDRIPIASNELATAYIFLDFIPGPKGNVGQLIFNVNEADLVVIEDTTLQLIERWRRLLISGQMKVEKQPKEHGDGYWFTAAGRPVEWAVYRELLQSDGQGSSPEPPS